MQISAGFIVNNILVHKQRLLMEKTGKVGKITEWWPEYQVKGDHATIEWSVLGAKPMYLGLSAAAAIAPVLYNKSDELLHGLTRRCAT